MSNQSYTYQDLHANYVNRRIQKIKSEPWITGDKLLSLINNNRKELSYNKRYIFKDLMKFLNDNSSDICALYGLRRTGKSVLMRQAIAELLRNKVDPINIMYITFSKNTQYTDEKLIDEIRSMTHNVKYIFIDEVSYISMDLENNSLNLLSDEFAIQGKRIVITGTFSFALKLLSDDALFDRMVKIDTTYFSFREAHNIFGYSLDHFIKYGGIILDTFENKITPKEYMNTAITSNIINSLIKSDKIFDIEYTDKKLESASDNIKYARRRLVVLIKRVLDNYLKWLIYSKIVNARYKYSDVGNLADLIKQRSQRDLESHESMSDIINISKDKYYKILNEKLGSIDSKDISKECFEEFLNIFKQIGIIEDLHLDGRYESCFVTNYLRYGLCEEIVNQIDNEIKLETNGRYSAELALDNLKGSILECIVYLDIKHSNKYNYSKYRSETTGYEVDLVIIRDNTLDLYEIKHSSQPLDAHARNIVNVDFLNEVKNVFEKDNTKCTIGSYNILYKGETLSKSINPYNLFAEQEAQAIKENQRNKWENLKEKALVFDWQPITVNFINVEEFLCNLWPKQ